MFGESYEGLDAACVEKGGRMASVLSSDETDKAIAACSSDGDYNDMCYVGLRWDGASWVWLDGSTYDYNYFDGGQGTNGDNEPCAAFYVNGGWSDQAMWHDISCPSGPTMEGADVAGICKREELNWDEALACYEAVYNQGCSNYIHMDNYGTYGFHPGSGSLEECAAAVQAYDGRDGCQADYFFYEDGGYCNCPVDACTEASENGNAGGSGQLYEFTACSAVGKMKQCMPAFPPACLPCC